MRSVLVIVESSVEKKVLIPEHICVGDLKGDLHQSLTRGQGKVSSVYA